MKVESIAELPLENQFVVFLVWPFYSGFTIPSIHRVDNQDYEDLEVGNPVGIISGHYRPVSETPFVWQVVVFLFGKGHFVVFLYILSVNEKLPVWKIPYFGKYVIQHFGYCYVHVSSQRQAGLE